MRSALVNATALAQWGRLVGLGDCLAMGRGARAGTEKDHTNVIADAVEALLAAVYLGMGLDAARVLTQEVTNVARSEARKTMTLATSSGVPRRPSGS